MSQVAVEKVHDSPAKAGSLLEDLKRLEEKVRTRAYDFFLARGGADGFADDDWLKAERDLVLTPESDLVEKDGKFELQVAVPGFDPKDVHVTATPESVVVRAESSHKHTQKDENVCFCEFSSKSLLREFDLPAPIDVDKVTASVNDGVLKLTATKAVNAQKSALAA